MLGLFLILPVFAMHARSLPGGNDAFLIVWAERNGRVRALLIGCVVTMLGVQIPFIEGWRHLYGTTALLFVFFIAFNLLEAILPSRVSRVAPPAAKGAALGVYNTTMSFGLFAGGALGGYLAGRVGAAAVFEFGAAMMLLWFIAVFGTRVPGRRAPAITQHEGELKHGLSQ